MDWIRIQIHAGNIKGLGIDCQTYNQAHNKAQDSVQRKITKSQNQQWRAHVLG